MPGGEVADQTQQNDEAQVDAVGYAAGSADRGNASGSASAWGAWGTSSWDYGGDNGWSTSPAAPAATQPWQPPVPLPSDSGTARITRAHAQFQANQGDPSRAIQLARYDEAKKVSICRFGSIWVDFRGHAAACPNETLVSHFGTAAPCPNGTPGGGDSP